MRSGWITLAAAVVLAAVLAGCETRPPRKSDSELGLDPQQARGRRVYDVHCLVCHEAYSASDRNGPSLMGMYGKKFMTSGQPVNDERVRDAIVLGRSKMPAYGDLLSEQQVNDLLAYLRTL